jgi:glycine dehydrogenase subunit 2
LLGGASEPTVLELSHPGRKAFSLLDTQVPRRSVEEMVPSGHLRQVPLGLPELSERDLVAHFTRLSHRQYSVDLGSYPLGSCTMKYNPKVADEVASLPGLRDVHPLTPEPFCQGWLEILLRLEEALCEIVGMAAATLQPPAGAAGELTGLTLIRAAHEARGTHPRKVLIPDSAHGTNPASVALAGYQVITVPSGVHGRVDVAVLEGLLQDHAGDIAAIMLTNPNTLGIFESDILQVTRLVHEAGALAYYDGANLNAIMGVARPGDMGFDVVHLNLHKTFATPHGGGGPGAGPVAVVEGLKDFLPGPRPVRSSDGVGFYWPARSVGRVHSFHGNALVLARALCYILMNGPGGLREVSERAVLNARWLAKALSSVLEIPYEAPCMHEVVFSAAKLHKSYGVRAIDLAKGLLDRGFHAPTIAFPLIVQDALMVEPTETESLETLQALVQAIKEVVGMAASDPGALHEAPRMTPVGRVDEARAARKLVLTEDDRARS